MWFSGNGWVMWFGEWMDRSGLENGWVNGWMWFGEWMVWFGE